MDYEVQNHGNILFLPSLKKTGMYKYLLPLFILFTAQTCEQIKPGNPEITENELRKHEQFLASDAMAGRYPGTRGDSLSALYIREYFKSYGMELPFDQGIQRFPVITSVKPGPLNKLAVGGFSGKLGKDYGPYAFSSTLPLKAPAVFAWYGLQIKNDTLQRNDLKQADLKGKWCVVLDGSPYSNLPIPTEREKAMMARDAGAAGIIIVTDEDSTVAETSARQRKDEGIVGIPALFVSKSAANKLLSKNHTNITLLKKEYLTPVSGMNIELASQVDGSADMERVTVLTRNICGILRSKDPAMKDEYILVGAHYDHLGMGGPGSSSRMQDTLAVHNGADDNASGVSMMLELAEKFAAHPELLKRSIIFAAFGAEEMGILGSKYLANHLPVPAGQIKAMINLDMVGRLREDRSLQVAGTGTSVEAESLLKKANADSAFHLAMTPDGVGPSDYSSFYGKNIPVFAFTTGAHMDYHTPFDDVDRLNFKGMIEVGNYVARLMDELDRYPGSLSFREAGSKDQEQGKYRFKVTLGIMPDFTSTDNNGLRVDFVTKGKPAWKGGMLKGDIITTINEMPVQNIQDYMFRLSKLSSGQTITVAVMRNGKKELLLIQL